MSYYYEKKTSTKAPIVYITDGADDVPIKSWEVEIAPTLTGKSAIECTQTGKNLASGGVYEYSVRNMIIAPVYLRAGTYTVSFNRGVNVQYIYIRKGATVSLVGDAYATKSNSTFFTFTADEDTYYYAQLYRTNTSDTWEDAPVTKPQIEVGSTATTYEPYTAPTTYTASLGRTIYGGKPDVVNGVGTDGYVKPVITSSMVNTAALESQNRIWRVLLTTEVYDGNFTYQVGVCNLLTFVTSYNAVANTDMSIAFNIDTGKQILIHNSNLTTLAEVKAFIDTLDIVYPLATPTDFTFTPITPTPETALGVNNFWADEGDSQIVYYTQIKSDDNYIIKESTLTSIANSIRAKTGNSAPIFVEDMADEISSIEMGGSDLLDLASQSTFDFTDDTYKTSALTIPDRMFNNNQRIRTVNISGIKTVESYAFIQCKATSLSFPDVETIGYQAFFQCRGASDVPLSIPNVVTIGEEAFKEAYVCGESPSYRFLDISKCVTIGNNAFRSTRINGFKMDSVETLGNMPWYGSWFSMTTVVFPKLKTAHDQMCRGMNFTNLVIGPDWESCGGGFAGYDMDWRNKYVYVYATTPPTMGGDFSLWKPPVAFYVPADSVDAYKAAPYWSQYASIILPLPSDHLTIDTWL